MTEIYDLQKIRTLLQEGFMAEELIDFCRVFPQFQPLYDQQLDTLSETELVNRLIEHAQAVSQFEKLLAWAKKHNPIQYAAYEPYIVDDVPEDVEARVEAMAHQAQAGSNPPTQTTTTDDTSSDKHSSQLTIEAIGGSIENATIAGRDVQRTSVRQVIQNVFRGSKGSSPARRNRQAMLKRVKSFWVEGFLEKSLHGLAMIALGLAEKAEAVDDPLNLTLKTTDQPDKMLPDGTQINDIFNEMDRALLILGEPGSGKTMSLLALARDAIAEAEGDPTKPIPIVFNLSSWSSDQKPLGAWLVDELKGKYQISSKISQAWIEDRELLLLLDGLDEVAQKERNACVEAINTFSQDYGMKNIVVCSRRAEYETLTAQLKLRGAVLVQPLTSEQVDDYLAQAGDQLEAIKTLIEEDEILRELTRSPLKLSIMTLAYRGMSEKELRGYGSVEERRIHLFDTYIDKMFHRNVRTKQTTYAREQTERWLTWLAQGLNRHNQTVFLIEQLQPSWLSTWLWRRLYMVMSRSALGLSVGFLVGGMLGAVVGLSDRPEGLTVLADWLLWFLAGGVIGGLLGTFGGVIIGFNGGSFPFSGQRPDLTTDIRTVEVLHWSVGKVLKNVSVGMFGFGLLGGVCGGLDNQPLGPALIGALVGGLVGGLFAAFGGLGSSLVETKTTPNQGIRLTLRNALVAGLMLGSIWGFIFGLLFVLIGIGAYGLGQWTDGLNQGLGWGLPAGVIGGVFAALGALFRFGSLSVIKHYFLRLCLYLQGHIPRNYARFLDYATELIFLRKVGGGYIFIHRLLLEHFANLKTIG